MNDSGADKLVGRFTLKDTTMRFLLSLLRDEQAATAVEYAVMLALILVVIIGSIASVGAGTGGMFSTNNTALQAAGFGS
jgi:pilus assembly protein Flp/PilA